MSQISELKHRLETTAAAIEALDALIGVQLRALRQALRTDRRRGIAEAPALRAALQGELVAARRLPERPIVGGHAGQRLGVPAHGRYRTVEAPHAVAHCITRASFT